MNRVAAAANRFTTVGKLAAALDWRGPVAFGLPFLLYLLTLAPTVYNLDSAEFTTAAATGGLVRATGYPLYLLLGRLWAVLPIGDVGYRLNLFSAFCGALTILLAERILHRLQVGTWATLGALGLLGTAPYFWSLSLIAEVYTLHTAVMAILILLLLRWGDNPTPLRLGAAALIFGLGMGNHLSTVLLVPGILWYVLTTAPRRALAPRAMLAALGGLLLGLSIYLYLPLRATVRPAFDYVGFYDATGTFVPRDLSQPANLWWLVTGRSFAGEMLAYRGIALWHEVAHFGVQLWRAFFILGIGPGLLGLVLLLRRNWRLGGFLLASFAANAVFYIDYRVVDKDTMFLPAYLIWAIWAALGYQALLSWLQGQVGPRGDWPIWLLRTAMVGAVALALATTWPQVSLAGDRSARLRGEAILRQVEPGALVLGWWDTVPVLQYLQLVEGRRPDVQTISRFLIAPEDLTELVAREGARRPVYIDSVSADLGHIVRVEPAGPLWRLEPRITR